MKNLNRVTCIGQLTDNPTLKEVSAQTAVATLRFATNYSWKDEKNEWKNGVDYHTAVAWQDLGRVVAESCKKGDRVFVEGRLRSRSWVAPDGTKRYATEIVAHTVIPMTKSRKKDVATAQADEFTRSLDEQTDAATEQEEVAAITFDQSQVEVVEHQQ